MRTLVIACCLAMPIGVCASTTMTFQGVATSSNGELLYTESHQVSGLCESGQFRPTRQNVEYRHADGGTVFANKEIRYDNSVLRPDITFEQPDFRESLSISYPETARLLIAWVPPGEQKKTFTVPFSDNVVVDAGFDQLVKNNWRKIRSGEPVTFQFLAPTRGETYDFILEPADDDRVDADHVVQIRPRGMLLRFVVDPIVLGYSNSGFLTDYVGLTNIRKTKEKNYTAHIRYEVRRQSPCNLTG